ncbi:hypothetical protein INT48_008505 [Thamnidium elegans]|uniref:Uncharacterized protein n=1 Tax=Thamnidium elegans TaxID=101142 RepID=A0A8H7SJS4_9FUNG|nr:hypothetical protein INT48_008505 [Thamnidium elegans]
MKYLYTYSMNEKEVMDYKKQRIGEPLTVTSLSIKESHASLNDNSDSETIGSMCNKRKHKFTQQYSNGPVLERDEDVYMDDTDKNDEDNMEMLLNDLTDSFRHLHIDNSSIDTEMTEADDVEVLEIIDTEITEAIDVEISEMLDTEMTEVF